MEKKFKLGVIGAGFMSTAIIKGVIKSKKLSAGDIVVSDVSQEALDRISENGVNVTPDNKWLADNSEFVLFAVKPQSFASVIEEIKGARCGKFISIMAGVKRQKIKSAISGALVARCMPNTPCAIGCGAIGIDLSDFTEKSDIVFIKNLFSSLAAVVEISESKLNAVIGVSGSSPAYFYLFLKYIIECGVKNGLDEKDAKLLAVNTMIGSGKMVLENPDKSLDELISAVCSKGGTTIEAINIFRNQGLEELTNSAIEACIRRSYELENI